MSNNDSLGDRMKLYEQSHNGKSLLPLIPAIIRLDGKAFHTFTQGLDRPFDQNLISLMIHTCEFLVVETNALIGYTQSDEITLILMNNDYASQIYFNGRIDKINSILASKCSVFFNKNLQQYLPGKLYQNPVFDCRCFNVPTEQEAVNVLVWREQDAVRNSIQMAGQAEFSHNQLHGLSCAQIQERLFTLKGINWNAYPDRCKRGTYIQRTKVLRRFTSEEISLLPSKHLAHTNPDLMIERTKIETLDLPIITKVSNIKDVIFRGAKYETIFR